MRNNKLNVQIMRNDSEFQKYVENQLTFVSVYTYSTWYYTCNIWCISITYLWRDSRNFKF